MEAGISAAWPAGRAISDRSAASDSTWSPSGVWISITVAPNVSTYNVTSTLM